MRLPGEITREDYDAHPGVRWSMLRHMRKSPLHYKHALDAQSKSTTALRTGSALHTLLFEPETYEERFTAYRASKSKGEGARKNWEAFQADAATRGLTILDEDEERRALAMAEAVARSGARRLVDPSQGRAEVPLTFADPRTGRICKARLDRVNLDGMVLDLKSTRSAELRNFGRQAWHLGYFHQAAFYSVAIGVATGQDPERIPFLFLAVENEPPYDVAVFEPCPETRYAAMEEVHRLMDSLAECERTGKWPGRYDGIQILQAPAYVLTSEDEEWEVNGKEAA